MSNAEGQPIYRETHQRSGLRQSAIHPSDNNGGRLRSRQLHTSCTPSLSRGAGYSGRFRVAISAISVKLPKPLQAKSIVAGHTRESTNENADIVFTGCDGRRGDCVHRCALAVGERGNQCCARRNSRLLIKPDDLGADERHRVFQSAGRQRPRPNHAKGPGI